MVDVVVRAANEGDLPYIERTWLSAAGTNQNYAAKSIYLRVHLKLIRAHLEKATDINVAINREHPDLILGWIVADHYRNVLHYVFVKHAYRRLGIAKKLVAESLPDTWPRRHTHMPAGFVKLSWDHHQWVYDSYAFLCDY